MTLNVASGLLSTECMSFVLVGFSKKVDPIVCAMGFFLTGFDSQSGYELAAVKDIGHESGLSEVIG